MNFLGQFYTDLANRLFNIVDENGKTIIQHIDLWNQQYNDDYKEVFGHPAVFLEYKSLPMQSTGRRNQLGHLAFDLHIASATKAKSSMGSQFTDRFLAHLELMDLINYWLTGWNGSYFGSIGRLGITPDHFYGDVIKHVVSYRCTIHDVSAVHQYTKVLGDKLVVTI
jgi:hypothetical protein